MKRFVRFLSLPLVVVALMMSACEITDPLEGVELTLEVEDAEVTLGNGVAVAVRPGQPAAHTQTVGNGLEVTSVEDLRRIELQPSYFQFTSAASKSGGAAATGELKIYIFVDGVPLPSTPLTVTIENDVVTNVTPAAIDLLGTTYDVDRTGVEAFLETLPADQRPSLEAWQSMTMDEVRAHLNNALSASSMSIVLTTEVTSSDPNDPLTGSIELQKLSFDARVTK